ncbi:capsule assembly Wzi family protein [Maribellus sediminis]|uniref:capsule assembly Wzi family protein n=1 Tax=Maribellus sediminis TaxID=2696285 RepID=UPI00143089FA|nr:capsule assembly Wzi family protein [Maribellus sediminis]
MPRIFVLLSFLFFYVGISAQNLQLESNTLAGSNGQLPFWLWANQLGRYDRNNNFIQHFAINGDYGQQISNSDFGFQVATKLDLLLADNNSLRFTELYGELYWRSVQLTAGAVAIPEKYNGLSASNGNLADTRNARPHPAIRVGFKRFVPVFVKWFSIYGFYEEGLLNDDRYVEDTHLHRKAFYFRFGTEETITFTGGLEHYVMWGGTHPVYGELPGWESYFDYVLGRPGGKNDLMTDQLNVMGNQYGTYQLEIRKQWTNFNSVFYVSHPFDDRSGMELENYRDNLYGFFVEINKDEPLIKGILLEYFYTKNQSGPFHLVAQGDGTNSGRGRDNYFNHGVYRSGATYQQFGMVSPFFAPVIIEDGISKGFESTRFSGWHFGATGFLPKSFSWKAMLGQTNHFGQYNKNGEDSFQPAKKQFASYFQLQWQSTKLPLQIGTVLAADKGDLFDTSETSRLGFQMSITWQIVR